MSTCLPAHTPPNSNSMVCAEKQGIGTTLRPDATKTPNRPASLRRALSADPSAMMQKLAPASSPPPEVEVSHVDGGAAPFEPAKKDEEERPGRLDIWSSIMSLDKANDKDEDGSSAPYVHPLVRRSKSALSQISLQICTESLGSENGSDGFSSLSPRPEGTECTDEGQVVEPPRLRSWEVVARPVKYKRPLPSSSPPQPRCFPPPLPSHPHQMQSRRENGRLVVEALSLPPAEHFCAERRGGRLLLSLFSDRENDVVEEETKTQEEEAAPLPERVPKPSSTVSVHMKQLTGLRNSMTHFVRLAQSKTTPWPTKFNEVVINFEEDAGAARKLLSVGPRVARLIPPPTSPFNDYEYCWRRNKAAAAAVLSSLAQQPPPLKSMHNKVIVAAPQPPVLMWSGSANEAEELVPLFWGQQGTQSIYLELGAIRDRNQLVN